MPGLRRTSFENCFEQTFPAQAWINHEGHEGHEEMAGMLFFCHTQPWTFTIT